MENTNNTNGTNNKKALYAIIAAAVIIILAIAAVIAVNIGGGGEDGNIVSETSSAGAETAAEERNDYTPVFMYFVSKNDEGYNEYMGMIDELKSEYEGDVTFNIVDVDEDPSAKENFPAEGNTPMLIMTNKSNDISAIEFKCSDKEKLAEDIENTLK